MEPAGTAVESVAATPSRVPAASETVRKATSETTRRTTGTVSRVAMTGPGTTVVTATGNHASKLVGGVGQVTEKAAATVDDQTQQLSGLSEGAGAKIADVKAFGNPPRIERLLQPAGTPPSGVLTSPGESPVFASPVSHGEVPSRYGPIRLLGVLPRVHAGGESLPARYRGFAGAELSRLGSLNGIKSTSVSSTTGARSNDPAPLDGPMPARGSSEAAAGPTGSFFVPLAALLALLALVVAAAPRRLGGVPAFRPSTPFVCALERPG